MHSYNIAVQPATYVYGLKVAQETNWLLYVITN